VKKPQGKQQVPCAHIEVQYPMRLNFLSYKVDVGSITERFLFVFTNQFIQNHTSAPQVMSDLFFL
jgi:hypothetical protein